MSNVAWLDLRHVQEEGIGADILLLVLVIVGRRTLDIGTDHVAHRIVAQLLARGVTHRCRRCDNHLGQCG